MTGQPQSKLAFIYGARETVWPGIVSSLLAEGGAVRAKLLECDAVVRARLDWSLEECRPDQRLPEHMLEPVLTSVQIALTEGWRTLGVEPDVIGARCGGEFAAAHVSGRLGLEDALEIACRLSQLIREDGVGGRMLSLPITVSEVKDLLKIAPTPFTIAADNDGQTTVISCGPDEMDSVETFLATRGLTFQRLGLQNAYHNPAVDRWSPAFREPFGNGRPGAWAIPVYSATARGLLDEAADDGQHFWRIIRAPAFVAPMAKAMLRDGCRTFLEVGGFPSLHGMIGNQARAKHGAVRTLASMRRGESFSAVSAEARLVLAQLGHCDPRHQRGGSRTTGSRPALTPDMFDPGLAQDPYPAYARLRRGPDIAHDAERDCWIVHRYDDVRAVLRDSAGFSSANASFEHTLLGVDGERHDRVRRALARHFSPIGMQRVREGVVRRIGQALDALAARGAGDIVADLAIPLPQAIVGQLLGLPASDLARLQTWAEALLDWGNPACSVARQAAIQEQIADCRRCLWEHFAAFRAVESPLAVTAFEEAQSGLTHDERVDLGLLFIAAGLGTTTSLIGSAVRILLEDPRIASRLRKEPDLVGSFIQEVVRHRSPIQRTLRRAVRATTVAGYSIPAGANLLVLIGAANRDPSKFPDAGRFRPLRQPNDHLSFGSGAHVCLGLWLARMEATLAVQSLLGRFSRIEVAGPLDDMSRLGNLTILGPARLPVAVHG